MTNFGVCAAEYLNNKTLVSLYNYTGPTPLIPQNPLTQINYEGCKKLCGTGPQLYTWIEAAATSKYSSRARRADSDAKL